MAVGNLLQKLTGREKVEAKNFLALVLTEEVVQAAVWQVKDDITEVVAIGTGVEWDGETGTSNELVTAVDATIAAATEGISNEINEVILGVPYSWTDNAGIVGSKRELIKKINQELELKPLGYVSLTDSVLSHLKMQEGTPATTILVQISKTELTVVLVRLGRIEGIVVEKRKGHITEEMISAMGKLGENGSLPSRIILFNNMHNLDDIAQELMQIPWQKHFEFLHLPKIETLPKDVAIRSLALAGGNEVAKSLGFVSEESVESKEEKQEEAEKIKAELGTRNEELLSEEEIGFGESEVELPTSEPMIQKKTLTLPKLTLPHFKFPKLKLSLGKWGIIGAGAVLIVCALGWAWWSIPQATVVIQVEPRWIDQEVALTLVASSDANVTGLSIPAVIEKRSVSGEKMIDTTGTKTVGEKAKGEVTIYNRTSLNKTLTKGTILTAPGGLKFSLDEDVSIASKSAGVDYVDVPGKANVKITASAIGTESNIASNTELTIASFEKSSYVAKNETAFSGGTAKEIQVVAKIDQEQLSSELITELTEQLSTEGSYLITSSIKTASEEYSAQIGEEAKTVSLSMTLSASLLSYRNEDIRNLLDKEITSAVPSGYKLAELPIQVDLTADKIDEAGESVNGIAKVKIALIPSFDENELARIIAGKSGGEIRQIIQNQIAGTKNIELSLTPKWWINKAQKLPKNSKRVEIAVQSGSL